ncbi:MAG: 30S ribosomal protein S1 [Deltaproteobacteria bacterium]|nr:30S ribosomal protein S1 [Deltaproteobacteria bacterium]
MREHDDELNEENEENEQNDEGSEGSFAELFEESLKTTKVRLEPGQKVEAKVLQIGGDWIFLDVGQKGEGVLDARELLDAEGNQTVAVGDKVLAYFLSGAGGELRFTTKLGSGAAGAAQMEEAWRSGIPVEGRIEKEIKGGYEIRLPGGVRAFCPFSQLGLRRQDGAAEVIGQSRSFRITQFGERGRNVVVSHRVLLEEEQKQRREALKETLQPGMVVKGVVTNVLDFGAFVDIGGLEGLVPISEVGYGRVEDIRAVLQPGQELEVAVKSCDWEKNRFSFSIRDTLADPWSRVEDLFREGGSYPGKVARLTPFGAFVSLAEGIDGLIHISKLGSGRQIKHAQEVLQTGQRITVTVEKIDREQHRISLLLAGADSPAAEAEEQAASSYFDKPSGAGMGTFADLLQGKKPKKRR